MKRLTKEDRRRIQRQSANIRFIVFVLIILAMGFAMGYTTACVAGNPQTAPARPQANAEVIPQALPETIEHPDEPEYIGTFRATAYCPCVKCCGIWSADHPDRGDDYVQRTSSGTIPTEGRTIAADWSVLPMGSEVIICGRPYVVEDTGGAIKGNRIDIYFESHEAALEYGVQDVDLYRTK